MCDIIKRIHRHDESLMIRGSSRSRRNEHVHFQVTQRDEHHGSDRCTRVVTHRSRSSLHNDVDIM